MPRNKIRAVPRAPKRRVKRSVIAAVDPQVARDLGVRSTLDASQGVRTTRASLATRNAREPQEFAIVSATFVD